jgi:trimeric autotransporter adhesin
LNTGSANTAVGVNALGANQAAFNNTAIGTNALVNNTSGNNNIALGTGAGSNAITASDTICIGIVGVDVTDGCYIGHVFEEPLDPDNLAMAIDVNGKVGTLPSSRRFKDHIKPMDSASEAILALKPVRFHYKSDKKCSPRFGLIAEEVAEVDPNLVARDKDGKPYSVRYDQVNAMLLNEFLKEHKKVQEQGAAIAKQREDFEAILARQQTGFESNLAKQQKQIEALASSLQGVKAELEITKRPVQVLANNP